MAHQAASLTKAEPNTYSPSLELIALLATGGAFFMVILDTSVVNLALPSIAAELGGELTGMQWIVDGYALVFASLLLTAGTFGDRYGSKFAFLVGLATFTAASVLCGFSRNILELEAARAMQGVGAALQVPTSLALLGHTIVDPARRARAIGGWSGAGAIAIAAGPIVGGSLVQLFGWRSIFFANLPIGVIGAFLAWRFIVDTPPKGQRKLDLTGLFFSISALGFTTFTLIEGSRMGWRAPQIIASSLAAVLSVAAFLITEARAADPMLPLDFFRRRTFSATVSIGLLHNFGVYGQIFVLSWAFQNFRHELPLAAGLSLMPLTTAIAVGVTLGIRLVRRYGSMLPLAAGNGLAACAGLAIASVGISNQALLAGLLIAAGVGTGMTTPAMNLAALDSLGADRSGLAAGALNAGRQIGGVFGVAILGSLIGSDLSESDLRLALLIGALAMGLAALCACVFIKARNTQVE